MTEYPSVYPLSVPTPFPVGATNVYAIEGENGYYLLDAGIASAEGKAALRDWLPRPVAGILLTHAHLDHLGLAGDIAREEQCPVYIHPMEFNRLRGLGHQTAMMRRIMAVGGVPRETVWNATRNYERSRQEYFQGLEGVDCRELSCGQIFLTAVGTLQVVHTPGHTLGHCCFYAAEKQLLFSGDHLLAKVWPNPLLEEDQQGKRYRSYVAYLESLKRVTGLRIEQVFPGHGPAFAGISEVMKRFQAYHWERERRVLNCLNKKGQTPYQITAQLYPEARELNLFLTLSKVWGYLDALTVQGLVKEGSDQGVITYCKIF